MAVVLPRLTAATQWAELDNVPLRANVLNIRHDGVTQTTVTNRNGPSLSWRACFPGSYRTLLVDSRTVAAIPDGKNVSCATVSVQTGASKTAHIPIQK